MTENFKPKTAKFYSEKIEYVDYKDVKTLQRFVNSMGKIESRKRTGASMKHQRQLATAIKRARHMALLPFVVRQMFGPTDLRKDTLIEIDGQPYRVVDYAQKQLGRGGSIVNTKLKNLVTGSVLDRTFKNDEQIKPADLSRQAVQYLYADHNQLHFMDNQTYEQFDIALSVDEEIPKYIVEGGTIDALVYDGQIIGFEWPKNVVLKVVSAPGADKGNSASATTKEVKLETGITAQTPQFIKVGDRLKIDTRSGTYLERAK